MKLRKSLTPKDTEEIKPGFFIQKWRGKHRQVNPIVWDGKYRWKEQMKTIFSVRTFIWIGLILFLLWSYTNDVGEYKQFYEDFQDDPIGFCMGDKLDGGGSSFGFGEPIIKEDNDIRINIQPYS